MSKQTRVYDNVHWHISEITHQIVAKTGIPSDRYHLGKIILKCLQDAPDLLAQIDGGANKSETNASILKRVVQCATALTKLGLVKGDVMVLMAPTHIDLCIPFYAALCLGIYIAPADYGFTENELSASFGVTRPKIIFCQSDKAVASQNVIKELNLEAHIITFDKGDNWMTFSELLDNSDKTITANNFRPTEFDPEETLAFLLPTSGTTGLPKSAMITHKNIINSAPYTWNYLTTFPVLDKMHLTLSPIQWLTAIMVITMSPIIGCTRLHTSQKVTIEHVYFLLKKYKPTWLIMSPTFATLLINSEHQDLSVLTCFKTLLLGGSAVTADLLKQIKNITPNTEVLSGYGMTELSGLCCNLFTNCPVGSIGNRQGNTQYRIVNPETEKDINEPNVPGELWIKGPNVFKGYYKNAAATDEAFADGEWLRTGDLVYRDEHWNFYFVDRMKLLLKYKSYHISPVELEAVILQHPGVIDAAVTSRPDPECGDLAIACVVRKPSATVSTSDIKDLVKNTLAESKHLRGGVIFLDALPLTPSTKVNRKKLKDMVASMKSE